MAGEGRQGPGSRGALWVARGPSPPPAESRQLGSPSRPEAAEAMAEAAQQQAQAQAGSSEDSGPPAAAAAEEDPAASGVPIGAAREMEEQEDNVASEATSVSSGGSGAPSPSANGFPGSLSGKEPRGTLGDLVEAGHDRLSATQAPSPEWHECPECGRGFGTSRALKVHRSYHVGRKRPHSGGSSSSSSAGKPPALLPPLALSGNPPESQDGRTATAPGGRGRAFHYICAECGLGFASPATLEGHRCEHGWRRSPPAAPLPARHKRPFSPAAAEANGEQDAEDGADGPYHCTECSGKFGLVSELHEHYILHARGEL